MIIVVSSHNLYDRKYHIYEPLISSYEMSTKVKKQSYKNTYHIPWLQMLSVSLDQQENKYIFYLNKQ
jgi:hypothetical protein